MNPIFPLEADPWTVLSLNNIYVYMYKCIYNIIYVYIYIHTDILKAIQYWESVFLGLNTIIRDRKNRVSKTGGNTSKKSEN